MLIVTWSIKLFPATDCHIVLHDLHNPHILTYARVLFHDNVESMLSVVVCIPHSLAFWLMFVDLVFLLYNFDRYTRPFGAYNILHISLLPNMILIFLHPSFYFPFRPLAGNQRPRYVIRFLRRIPIKETRVSGKELIQFKPALDSNQFLQLHSGGHIW